MTICWTLFKVKLKNKMNIVIYFLKTKKKTKQKTVNFCMENIMVPMLITNVHEYANKNQCADFLGRAKTKL